MAGMTRSFTLTRSAALGRLDSITPHLGRAYTSNRNTDIGSEREPTTSALSPFLRRRLLLEEEAVAAALDDHGPDEASKFIEEVFWRSYFKGHLETRPTIWTNYLDLVPEGRDQLGAEPALRRAFDRAVTGNTGIDGFDDWARELTETGWLHNHTRMWFASIWIFTLRLPWALGADFFLCHLIDGDPASNTLSWRWVAGLHTPGKAYAARADNIRRFTDGRFSPRGLNETPVPLDEPDRRDAITLPRAGLAPSGEVALLLHLDDLNPESLDLGGARVTRIGGLLAHAPDAARLVRQADEQAMSDGLARAEAHFGCAARPITEGWADGLPIVTPWAPVGPSATALPATSIRLRRPWDDLAWPRSTRGYFQVKTAIPTILRHVLGR
ncbi:FAD-binding domain-containing protein [Lichenihabitans psoromatis]|uniref:FAD-binding domain-containing protein n=1 Tax=Lichenihabitans psoromatis TaxID=2528642 RepID=UPI00315D9D5F